MPYVVKDKILFLSEASKILSSSLDYNVTLAIISKLIVTSIADFCLIDIFDGYRMKRLAVNVSDPKKHELALKMFDFLPNPKNKQAIYDTARLGAPTIIEKVTKKWLREVSRIPEEREVITQLGLNSHMFVPLKSRGEVIGVITIASMEKDFSYSQEDAIFIEELAIRAGTVVDKARLYMEAQEALRTRDEFLSIASHELKTPLTSILLNLQGMLNKIYKTKSQAPEINEIIKLIELSKRQSHRMSRLINDLLNVSVASTGRLKIEKERMDLVGLVGDVITHFKQQLRSSNIRIVVVGGERPIVGKWDIIRLEQVIANLISNAIKYGDKKPITIEMEKRNGKAYLKVRDRGIGIREGDENFIFERFKRAVSAKDYSGLGVGLYISRQIVEAHRGRLYVESHEGKGATFIMELPTGLRS